MSHRQFPFDSPDFEFTLNFNPPIRPSVVRVVNRTDTFMPLSKTLKASWNDPGNLTISIQFTRNPFVKTAVIILGLGAAIFGIFLGFLKTLESLATATASYFSLIMVAPRYRGSYDPQFSYVFGYVVIGACSDGIIDCFLASN